MSTLRTPPPRPYSRINIRADDIVYARFRVVAVDLDSAVPHGFGAMPLVRVRCVDETLRAFSGAWEYLIDAPDLITLPEMHRLLKGRKE